MKIKSCFFVITSVICLLFFTCTQVYAEYNEDIKQFILRQYSNKENASADIFIEKCKNAISEDNELKILYSKFSEPGLLTSDRQKIIEEFLYKLTNAENIEENDRGEYINAKHLAVIEFYMDQEFYSTSQDKISQANPKNPNIVAGAKLESVYEQIKALVYSEFISESLIKDLIESSSVYFNVNTGEIQWYFDKPQEILDEELKNNPQTAKERIYNFGAWAIGLGYFKQKSFFDPFDDDCFYTHFTKNDRELKWQFDSIGKIPYDLSSNDTAKQGDEAVRAAANTALIDFHARRGDDVIYGDILDDKIIGGTGNDLLDGGDGDDEIYAWSGDDIIWGGNGNDVIFAGEGDDIIFSGDGDDIIYPDHQDRNKKSAGEGNDIIYAGKGNDKIYSVYGDDTYIFNLGDGHDIIEDKYGEDTIYFGEKIYIDNIKPVRVKKDLVLKIEDDDSSITIKNYYKINKNLYKIEYLQFEDDTDDEGKEKIPLTKLLSN